MCHQDTQILADHNHGHMHALQPKQAADPRFSQPLALQTNLTYVAGDCPIHQLLLPGVKQEINKTEISNAPGKCDVRMVLI